MRSVSAPNDVTEVATCPEIVRRALLNEAKELQVQVTQLQSAFHRLTPELSRPVAGRRTRASVARARGRRHDAGSA
jgi:hypothetical protein